MAWMPLLSRLWTVSAVSSLVLAGLWFVLWDHPWEHKPHLIRLALASVMLMVLSGAVYNGLLRRRRSPAGEPPTDADL